MGAIFDQGHALVVGVGGADDLPDTVTDAKGIAGILSDPARCAYPKDQVKLLTGSKAGRNSVLKGLDSLAGVPSDTSVIVYFSGHGYQVGRGKKTTYLMPHGYDIDNLEDTAISGAEFADKLGRINADRMLVLLDCCHAGGFDGTQVQKTKSAPKSFFKNAALPDEAIKMLSKKQGRVLIASSQGDEDSYPGRPYSAFTTALIAAFCGEGNAKKDSYVRVVDLALYTREAVVALTENKQHPTMDFENADNFVVAYYAGGGMTRKGLPHAIKQTKIETKPGSGQFAVFDQKYWTVLGNVTNINGDQTNIYGDTTNIQNLGFYQPGWKVNSVTQAQGDIVTHPKDRSKKRR